MFSFQVSLKDIEHVKQFVTATAQMSCDVEIQAGAYLVDGKSIMGIFSLDRNAPVTVIVHGEQAAAHALQTVVGAF